MKKAFLCICLLHEIYGTTTAEVFRKYPNHYFIETGSYYGEGIQNALSAGFHEIYSIELSPFFHEHCRVSFSSFMNIHLVLGNSTSALQQVLCKIDAPTTFWLDAHYSSGATARGETNTPLLEELEAIRNHPIKTHTILIDDIRHCGTAWFDFITFDDIVKKLHEINEDYCIGFENGHIENDVLVARPRNQELGNFENQSRNLSFAQKQ